jgi:hypothetical protein
MKVLAYMMAIPVHQRYAFTLKISPAIQRRALGSPLGVAKYLQARIARALRDAFDGLPAPDFLMALEWVFDQQGVTELITLHVHGVVKVPDHLIPGAGPGMWNLDKTEDALRSAGGVFVGRARARQLDTRHARNPVGWTAYILKNRLATHAALKSGRRMAGLAPHPEHEGIVAATANLRAEGQRWYEEARRSEEMFLVGPSRKRKPKRRWGGFS